MRSVSIRPPGAIRLVPTLMTRRTVKGLAIYQPIAGACDFLLDLTRDLILKGEALRNLAYAARVLETGAQAVHARSFAALRMMPLTGSEKIRGRNSDRTICEKDFLTDN